MDRIVLTASDGMVYTDGVQGGKVVYLAEGKTADGWYEIPETIFIATLETNMEFEPIVDSEPFAFEQLAIKMRQN